MITKSLMFRAIKSIAKDNDTEVTKFTVSMKNEPESLLKTKS